MKRFFTWKVFRRLLIAFAVFITLIAVAWAIENYRGRTAWLQYKATLIARGEKLDFKEFVPPPVPDEKNLAMAPMFQKLDFISPRKEGEENPIQITASLRSDGKTAPDIAGILNLDAWQEFYRGNTNYPQSDRAQSAAEDVLAALSRFDDDLRQLREEAAKRPLCRFPIQYDRGFDALLPHIYPLREIIRLLHLRSAALLELGRNQEALEDVHLAMRLADSIKDEPFLVSYLVRGALTKQISSGLFVEGVVRHAWTDQQLAVFENYFASTDLLTEYQSAIRAERAMFIAVLDDMARGKIPMSVLFNANNPSQTGTGGWWLPTGWLRQNQKYIAQTHQDYNLAAVNPEERRAYPQIPTEAEETLDSLQKGLPNPHKIFALMVLPAITKVTQRAAEIQTTLDHARIACALERYYIANQTYPASLQDLVPQYIQRLPHDLTTGGPVKYQRTSNGFYKLHSAGWDAKDDGGKPTPTAPKPNETWDWVWQFPG